MDAQKAALPLCCALSHLVLRCCWGNEYGTAQHHAYSFTDPGAIKILLFVITIFASSLVVYRVLVKVSEIDVILEVPELRGPVKGGISILPRRVLAGSSHNIWFYFKRDAHSRDDPLELELQAAEK